MARRTCYTNASLAGGISSTLRPRFVKSFRRQSLTSSTAEVLSHRRHVNLSMTRTLSSCGSKQLHGSEYLANTSVASSNTCHVVHAGKLPFWPKAEKVSQPVNAYQKGSPPYLPHLSPKAAAKLSNGIQRLFIPAPSSILGCFSPVEAKPPKQEMNMMTTSVSIVTIVITSWLWLARSSICTKILISASSWLHGANWVLLSSELFGRARLPLAMTKSLKPVSVTSSSASQWNSSVLLPSTRRKDVKFLGRWVPFTTAIHLPCQLFDLVADLMLYSRQTSKTASMRVRSCFWNLCRI